MILVRFFLLFRYDYLKTVLNILLNNDRIIGN